MGSEPPGGYSTVSMRPSLPGMSERSFDKTWVTLVSGPTSAPVARSANTKISFVDVIKLTYLSTRNRRCGLSEPGFEASLAELCGFVRHERSEAQFRPGVTRFGVSDDLARIFECGQLPPDEFVNAELFRTSY